MSAVRRFTQADPCPACGGNPDMPRGQGIRCIGFQGSGDWFHCSREGEGTRCKYHDQSTTWSHRARGKCPCGVEHAPGDANEEWTPPTARAPQTQKAEVRPIGDAKRAKIVEVYPYLASDGDLLFEVCRTEPKSFRQRRPWPGKPGEWVWSMAENPPIKDRSGKIIGHHEMPEQPTTVFRIPELLAALAAGDPIWIVEGEKDVLAMEEAGCVATCNAGGAGKWRDDLSQIFLRAEGCTIRIVQDKDAPDHKGVSGQEHARRVFESVSAILPEGSTLAIVEARAGKDASDHLEAGHTVEEFSQVWPEPDDLLEHDPARFKRLQLRRALATPETVLAQVADDPPEAEIARRQPLFRTGIVDPMFCSQWRGAVAISGEPSAGKSYVAISTAVDAALAGWDVFYLSCEMHEDIIRDRAARAVASASMSKWDWKSPESRTRAMTEAKRVRLPDTWHHLDVGIGVTIEMVIEMLANQITARPTMVVLDSLSSFVDSMANSSGSDSFGMADLREVTRWIVGTRKLTHGHLAFILLSEINKEGRAKGRFLDHRCDTAIAMTTDPDSEKGRIKKIRVTKNWWGPIGDMGDCVLDWELGRLIRHDADGGDGSDREDVGF